MRVTIANIEQAITTNEERQDALEAFNDAAQAWLDATPDNGADADERRDARDELDAAIEVVEGLGIKL